MTEFTASSFNAVPAPHTVRAVGDVVLKHLAKRGHIRSRKRWHYCRILFFLLRLEFNLLLIFALDLVDGVDLSCFRTLPLFYLPEITTPTNRFGLTIRSYARRTCWARTSYCPLKPSGLRSFIFATYNPPG